MPFCPVVASRTRIFGNNQDQTSRRRCGQFLELADQVFLVVEAAGRIGDHETSACSADRIGRIEDDGSGIGPVLMRDDAKPRALAMIISAARSRLRGTYPRPQALSRPLRDFVPDAHFRDRRRFADTVHTENHEKPKLFRQPARA